jgi:glycine cleavage system H lipoate-binding protein
MVTTNRLTKNRRPMIPAGDLPCVWMTAGVISFRLCDRDFDCSRCPLDHALRNTEGAEVAEERSVPPDLFYCPRHCWVRVLPGGVLEVGLTELAAALVEDFIALSSPVPGERIERGRPAVTVKTPFGSVSVLAPFTGLVTESNRGALPGDWLYRAVPDEPATALTSLLSGTEARDWAERQAARVRDLLAFAGTETLDEMPRESARRVLELLFGTSGDPRE